MKFFKKSKGAKTPSPSADQQSGAAATPDPDATVTASSIPDEQRRAEFLAMLAEEERLHREKMNARRAEIGEDTIPAPSAPQTPLHDTPSYDTPSYDTPEDYISEDYISNVRPDARTEIRPVYSPQGQINAGRTPDTHSETTRTAQSRAETLGLGGTDFLTGSAAKFDAPRFNAPELRADIPDDADRIDVTPKTHPTGDLDTPNTPIVDPSIDMGQPLTRRMNMGDLRLDVARITSDIDNGEALYRRAQQRVSSLLTFVERAEVDFSLLDRLEPENRRLKARNRTLSSEVETQSHKINVIQSDLDEHRRRLAEVKAQYDTANGNLARSMKAVADRDREIKRLNGELNALALKLERQRTSAEVESRENAVLRDRIGQISDALETLKTERTTLSKMSESLKIDCDDHRNARDRMQAEVHDLRHALDSAQKQNNQMKSEMVALHEEITTFKTQYEFNIISRDDRIYALEAQIEDLSKQVQIKDEIVANAAKDVSELRKARTAQDLERERLEKMLNGQSMQLDDAQAQLLKSKQNMQELDQRYRDVAAALSVTQSRRSHQAPAAQPDIYPEMDFTTPQTRPETRQYQQRQPDMRQSAPQMAPPATSAPATPNAPSYEEPLPAPRIYDEHHAPQAAQPAPAASGRGVKADPRQAAAIDDLAAETEQSIEDRIMDYKLGLRKNIF